MKPANADPILIQHPRKLAQVPEKKSHALAYLLVAATTVFVGKYTWDNKWGPHIDNIFKTAYLNADTNHDKKYSQEEVCAAYNKLGIRCDGKFHTLAELGPSKLNLYNKIRAIEEEKTAIVRK